MRFWLVVAAVFAVMAQALPSSQSGSELIATGEFKYRVAGIYYINLDSRPDRREWMDNQLLVNANGVPFQRFPAVKVANFTEAVADPRYRAFLVDRPIDEHIDENKRSHDSFVVSVFLSHMTLYSQLANNVDYADDDLVLILEDDVYLEEGWQRRMIDDIQVVPGDWEVVRFGTWGETRDEDKIHNFPDVFECRPPFWVPPQTGFYGGAHAVVVRRRTLGNFLEHMMHIGLMDVDGMMTNCCDTLKSYLVNDHIVGLQEDLMLSSDNPDHHPELPQPSFEEPDSLVGGH